MLEARMFKEPKDHILFKGTWSKINSINTEIQLRSLEKDIDALNKYIMLCQKRRDVLDKERRKCVKYRLNN